MMGQLARWKLYAFMLAGMQALPVAALGQNPQLGPPGAAPTPVTPPGPSTTPPERIRPPGPTARDGTLNDRLSRQNSTIPTPDVDPDMTVKPAPDTHGTMPVLPPPGSPGGDRSVVPK